MEDVRKQVGNNIRKVREDKKISQEDLALRSDVHRTYISQVERGETNITILTLQRIAIALGIDIKDLL
jgi:transcriptional regulator with XRE-family HTH domain